MARSYLLGLQKAVARIDNHYKKSRDSNTGGGGKKPSGDKRPTKKPMNNTVALVADIDEGTENEAYMVSAVAAADELMNAPPVKKRQEKTRQVLKLRTSNVKEN